MIIWLRKRLRSRAPSFEPRPKASNRIVAKSERAAVSIPRNGNDLDDTFEGDHFVVVVVASLLPLVAMFVECNRGRLKCRSRNVVGYIRLERDSCDSRASVGALHRT